MLGAPLVLAPNPNLPTPPATVTPPLSLRRPAASSFPVATANVDMMYQGFGVPQTKARESPSPSFYRSLYSEGFGVPQTKARESPSPSFYRSLYSEIEEVGWEHLLKLEEDLSFLSFRVLDMKGKTHVLEISLPRNYPECAPSIAADVPYMCELVWSKKSRLKDAMQQFTEHLQTLQEFWSTLDDIDKALWVVDAKQHSSAISYRQIGVGDDCYLLLSLDARKPRSLPECRFFGPDSAVNPMLKKWKKNGSKWTSEKAFHENLAVMLETTLPRPPSASCKDDEPVDCGICYAQYLPVDDELGANSGSAPNYTCDNYSCSRAFHTVCLRDWLRSITTTRQSFDVLFGNCPYCSEPVAVKGDGYK